MGLAVDPFNFKYSFMETLAPIFVRLFNFACFFTFVIPHVSTYELIFHYYVDRLSLISELILVVVCWIKLGHRTNVG